MSLLLPKGKLFLIILRLLLLDWKHLKSHLLWLLLLPRLKLIIRKLIGLLLDRNKRKRLINCILDRLYNLSILIENRNDFFFSFAFKLIKNSIDLFLIHTADQFKYFLFIIFILLLLLLLLFDRLGVFYLIVLLVRLLFFFWLSFFVIVIIIIIISICISIDDLL